MNANLKAVAVVIVTGFLIFSSILGITFIKKNVFNEMDTNKISMTDTILIV